MSQFIEIREVGPRDGLQIIPTFVPTKHKIEWIRAAAHAGIREVEACSFVNPALLPQFADATEVIAGVCDMPELRVAALVPNLKGAQRAVQAGVHKINHVMSVSASHNMANVRKTIDQSIAEFSEIVAFRNQSAGSRRVVVSGGLSTAFGCTIEGKVDEGRAAELAATVIAAGADELIVADTVGYANPLAIRRVFRRILDIAGTTPIVAHFHDTRGTGLANVLAALDVGVTRFDASLAGLGGCPFAPGATGNIVTEDVVYLCESMGLDTGIDIEALIATRAIIAEALPHERLLGSISVAGLPKTYADRHHAV